MGRALARAMRSKGLALGCLVAFVSALAACGAASPPGSQGDPPAQTSQGNPPPSGGGQGVGSANDTSDGGSGDRSNDAASCQVLASSYDQTCREDADCVLVPPGGNVCDPCSSGSGDFNCNLASVNRAASASFTQSLRDALRPLEGTPQYYKCVIQSCPLGAVARCNAGVCTAGSRGLPRDGG
jgi:hypothetical protein